jgi:hypothetical protein
MIDFQQIRDRLQALARRLPGSALPSEDVPSDATPSVVAS